MKKYRIQTAIAIILLFTFFQSVDSQSESSSYTKTTTITYSSTIKIQYSLFSSQHNRSFKTYAEYSERLTIFNGNVEKVTKHNNSPGITYKLEINNFADLTKEELAKFKGFLPNSAPGFQNTANQILAQVGSETQQYWMAPVPTVYTFPSWVDWRYKQKVSSVKYQGPCGACWAFTVAAHLESAYSIIQRRTTIPNLSEQYLVSCDTSNWGCNGGNTANAIEFLSKTTGMYYEGEFTYDENGKPCSMSYPTRDLGFPKMKSQSWLRIRSNPNDMKQYILMYPITITMQITGYELYKEGIMDQGVCRPGNIYYDHTALIMGFGVTTSGIEYWILKNSWGTDWGENGFFRVRITNDEEGVCGINHYPVIANFER